jgi:hypothetical protein
MAFEGVLPKTVYDVGPGGSLVTGAQGVNALTRQNLENRFYAPLAQAQVAQQQAQAAVAPAAALAPLATNPMIWAALAKDPQQQQNMINLLTNASSQAMNNLGRMGQGGQMQSNQGNMPVGLQQLMSLFGGGGSSPQQNQMNAPMGMPMGGNDQGQGASPHYAINDPATSQGSGTPLVPSSGPGGLMSGVTGNMTARYQTQPYEAGKLVSTSPGQVTSVPSSSTVTAGQQALLAAKRAEPQLQRLANEWEPFMNLKGMGHMVGQSLGNLVTDPDTRKTWGWSNDLPSKYAAAKAETETAPEALLKAYGLRATNESLDRLQRAIEPMYGENTEGYKTRIKNLLEHIRTEQEEPTKQALAQGYNVSGGVPSGTSSGQPEGEIQATRDIGNKHYVQINNEWHEQK